MNLGNTDKELSDLLDFSAVSKRFICLFRYKTEAKTMKGLQVITL